MAESRISGVRVRGLACAVPEQVRPIATFSSTFGRDEVEKISQSTGVRQLRVAGPSTCTSDLCRAAAQRLLDETGWDPETVDALIFVSQTPDYVLPATSCSLHGRLGLGKHCAAFDVNLGCSGYIYGLWLGCHLVAMGSARRLLLLVGDTISRVVSPSDRSTVLLFGDAGTATALERDDNAGPVVFQLGTDGAGQDHIMVPGGLFRAPHTESSAVRSKRSDGNIRSDEDLFMNGPEVFAFTLREVPRLMEGVLRAADWTAATADAFVLHQANQFMMQHLAKRMRLPLEKVIIAMADYGNTSSASVPLAIAHCLRARLQSSEMRLVLAGFGVGFSWAAAALSCGPLALPELVVLPDTESVATVSASGSDSNT